MYIKRKSCSAFLASIGAALWADATLVALATKVGEGDTTGKFSTFKFSTIPPHATSSLLWCAAAGALFVPVCRRHRQDNSSPFVYFALFVLDVMGELRLRRRVLYRGGRGGWRWVYLLMHGVASQLIYLPVNAVM